MVISTVDLWSAKLIPVLADLSLILRAAACPASLSQGSQSRSFSVCTPFTCQDRVGNAKLLVAEVEARSAVCATWSQRPEQTHRAIARGVATLTHLLPKSVKEVPVGAQDDHLPNISARQCPPEQPWPKAGTACPVSSLAPRSKSCGEQGSGPTGAPWAWMAVPSQLHFLCPGLHPQAPLA